MAGKALRVILVEDSEDDALLLLRELERSGYETEWRRVDDAAGLRKALDEREWNMVFADYSLPGFGGREALEIIRRHDPYLPVIVVSGSAGEREAVEMLRAGARDYFVKGKLGLLAQAVARELAEAAVRAAASRAEAALRASEARYKTLFEMSPLGIYELTPEGDVLSCNPAMARMLGFKSPGDMQENSNAVDFYDDPKERERYLDTLRREGGVENYELKLRRADGAPVWILETAALLPREEGEGEIISGMVLDITERVRGEEERVLLSTLVEQAQEGILVTDLQGSILYANPAMSDLTGYAAEELQGQNPRLLKSGRHEEAFYGEMWRTITSGETWRGRIVNKKKDGSPYTAEMVITPVREPSGEISAFVGSQRDITKEVGLQERLDRAKDMETIGMVAGGMAHEVRNPLFAITTVTSAMRKKFGGREELKPFLDHITEQTARLSAMMDDLLLLGRPIPADAFAPCALEDVVSDALTLLENSRPGAGCAVAVEEPSSTLVVRGDAGKLSQVFVNLVGNALHFCPPEKKVTVRLRREDDLAVAEVLDEGPGLPEDLLPKLFQPFKSRRRGGTGLGLAIVQKIVDAHGGTAAGANRDPGPGALFTVTLPLLGEEQSEG